MESRSTFLHHTHTFERWGDAEGSRRATEWTTCVGLRRVFWEGNPPGRDLRRLWRGAATYPEGLVPEPPRKASSEWRVCPYRKPTLVGWQNTAKVNGRTFAKELGNMTP